MHCIVVMLEGYSFADDHVRLTSSFQYDPTMHALWAGIHLQWTGDVTTSLQLGCLVFGRNPSPGANTHAESSHRMSVSRCSARSGASALCLIRCLIL